MTGLTFYSSHKISQLLPISELEFSLLLSSERYTTINIPPLCVVKQDSTAWEAIHSRHLFERTQQINLV
jgi:hypothetical protein